MIAAFPCLFSETLNKLEARMWRPRESSNLNQQFLRSNRRHKFGHLNSIKKRCYLPGVTGREHVTLNDGQAFIGTFVSRVIFLLSWPATTIRESGHLARSLKALRGMSTGAISTGAISTYRARLATVPTEWQSQHTKGSPRRLRGEPCT